MLFLGLAANFTFRDRLRHFFAFGDKSASLKLRKSLARHYDVDAKSVALFDNGRTALSVGLKSLNLPAGTAVIVNGFTCYAVVQGVVSAGLKPIYADISPTDLNFSVATLEATLARHPAARVIILQNTFGLPVDLPAVVDFAKRHHLIIVEDLAHSVSGQYPDGRKFGTVGEFAILSFGKGKAVDTVTGGALILRNSSKLSQPSRSPHLISSLRARLYPSFCLLSRALFSLRANFLARLYLGLLFRLKLITRSADADIEPTRRLSHWQASLLLGKIKRREFFTASCPREFYLVKNRASVLKKLQRAGYYLPDFWYEKPISPARYYSRSGFNPKDCPNSVLVAEHIINLPRHYPPSRLAAARAIIEGNRYDETN